MNDFLTNRKTGIGGSDIGAILGVSKFKSAVDVYLSKTTDQPQLSGEHLYWGHALEQPIIKRFCEETGSEVQYQPPLMRHPENDWALANADALIIQNGKPAGILEIKTSSAFKTSDWGAADTDEIPMEYIAQVQWYMGIFDLDFAYLAVLIGGNQYRHYRLERDRELFDTMLQKARDFWFNHVQTNTPPEARSGNDSAALYPKDNGDSAEADSETLAAYNELKALKEQERSLKDNIAAKEDLLKIKIGAFASMAIDGNPIYTWKQQSSKRFDSKAFQAAHPDLYQNFVKTSETRVLRLK